MISPTELSKPSISVSSWLRVCSRSSWPPMGPPTPRARPSASSSSMKMMAGACPRACSNRSRTRAAPTPTNISTNSDPEMEKKGTAASPTTALASNVLPVPGGPTSNTPLGMRAPSRPYSCGFLRKSTISTNSALASSTPATSAKVTPVFFSMNTLARLLPMLRKPPMPCFSAKRRNRKNQTPKKATAGRIQESTSRSQVLSTTRA